MKPRVDSLDHLVLTVSDIPRSIAFYETALGMVAEKFTPADGTTRWALKFGNHKINLHQAGAEFEPKAQCPTPGSADLCFLTKIPLSEWCTRLDQQNIPILEGPVPRTGATGLIVSIYLRDPDGNLLEISNESNG
ncbi:VOC family protein [uncultured Roseovarius sp.]|uniref:VOC family protein n=1 Tax=uncultured Roseovarius sp. TaxID=293344 RepID=UPI0025CBC91A|nr:VOC family protein [uncultured Roseovarius sp.]